MIVKIGDWCNSGGSRVWSIRMGYQVGPTMRFAPKHNAHHMHWIISKGLKTLDPGLEHTRSRFRSKCSESSVLGLELGFEFVLNSKIVCTRITCLEPETSDTGTVGHMPICNPQ